MASPSTTTRLTELTTIIATETKKVEDYFAQHNLPNLSFAADGPADFPVPGSNGEIQASRRTVINATQELHDLMVGPRETVRWLAWSYNDNLSLQAVYQFNIAKAVPIGGEASYTEISKAVGVDEINVRRLVRHAMTNRIFRESRDGYVAHTAVSRILVDDPRMSDWVGLCSSDFFPSAAHTVSAMIKFPMSQEPSQTGFNLGFNVEVPMFVEIGKDPARAKRFGGGMTSLTGGEGYEVEYLVDGYPWAELGEATVVDVGGSHGFVCVALGRKFPSLRFVVQDLPTTVADGPSEIPPELSNRIEFQAHDFFTEQPIKDADVYFFRWIFHNWSDKYSVKILQSLIPALKPGARIVINDNITRTMDVTMLELLNARERDVHDWDDLFRQADPRFKFLGVKRPEGSRMYTIEALWTDLLKD
ncbi:O-methyltransferase [Cryomyces antarcticus]